MPNDTPRGALLVGSVPLEDSGAVFRAASELLGTHLKRIPDGETGVRKQWVAWQYPLLKSLSFVAELRPGVRHHWLPNAEPELMARLVRIGNAVPDGVELGYHLCYGDSTTRHFKEPEDTALLVRVSNTIAAGLTRSLQWIHLPVPIERDDA